MIVMGTDIFVVILVVPAGNKTIQKLPLKSVNRPARFFTGFADVFLQAMAVIPIQGPPA
jgi:hypothetical protein